MKKVFILFSLAVLVIAAINMSLPASAADGIIINGTQFKDTSGNVIHAHGGGMIQYGGYYYWYGEYRDNSNKFLGVRCYRSADLINWEYRGEVLSPSSAPELASCNVERPKVMYNASTKEFVMWMHWENGVHYGEARAAVAYCKTPDGKYTYLGSFRPFASSGVIDHDRPGYMSRDCNVFVDTDGKGYFISASNENMDLHLYELTPDYKGIASLKAKLFVGKQREAPCLIKRNGYYYLITSGCTGWDPNQAKYAYSRDLASGWSELYNLGDSTTYKSQPTFIIPVQGTKGTSYLYMGDRWAGAWGGKVNDSQYVWLPLIFRSDTVLELPYYSSIKINAAEGTITEPITDTTKYKIVNRNSGKVLDARDGTRASQLVQWTDNGSESQKWYLVDMGSGYKKIVSVSSGYVLDIKDDSKSDGAAIIQWYSNGGYNQQWQLIDAGGGYYKLKSRSSGKILDVYKWSTEDGGVIQQWSDVDGSNQQWMLVPVNDTPTPTPVNTPTPPHYTVLKGDVNGDGEVNSIDYGYVKMYLLGMINKFPTADPNVGYAGADIDGNGDVNSIDFALLKSILLGIKSND
ncbi:RICIN domain-containing protein [Acetivibrio clariflavus]|uniref:Beta-xylosidase n=1 Tax=Acetivibrio clariflavus (strain DSM 19732 / NBRC 101661 / EBR45) TaxID=720554 RepID=G8M307_ACECE|nr:RICIN domain-containing protein [Acetivibrio clariflavus]AEV69316.1 beta-xylosidase [Acetivibrio clariflavus DSM 19732]